MGGDFNLMRNMAQRLFKGKRLIYLSIILLALVLLNLGLSVILRWQKQETCESIADVWKDVGHLVSQKYDTDMDLIHNLSLVKIYFKSNLLDGILYEWRYIEKSGLLPPTAQTTKYISLDAEGQNNSSPQNGESYSIPMVLIISAEETIFHNNPNFFDYTKKISTVDVDGRAIYSVENGSLLWKGYTSEIVFSDCIIEPQNRIENQKILKGEFYETVKAEYSSISSDIAIEDRCGDEIFLDLGILQNQCQ